MNDRRTWIAAVLAISGTLILAIGCFQVRSSRRTSDQRLATQSFLTNTVTGRSEIPQVVGAENGSAELSLPDSEREKASLHEMVSLMRDFAFVGSNSTLLFSRLKESGQNPEISAMSTVETGSVITITTRDPMFGTRYFRSIFERVDSSELMDFMMFEFRPGPQAMEEAEAMVREVFHVTEPRSRDADVAVYNISHDYEIMVNRIVQDHLEAEPTRRRYTKEDLGVIEVTVQLRTGEHED